MKTEFRASFLTDVRRIRDRALLTRVQRVITVVERAGSLSEIPNLRKLAFGASFYRVRIGSYRAGLTIEGDTVTFLRLLDRKDIYRYFP